jgi:thiol-disulfide isomerase/thioredoxin
MMYLQKPIGYLVNSDFDEDGNLINKKIPNNIPILIMIQANFCGYCSHAKPAFQEFANKNEGKVFCATIQGDGKEVGEKELMKKIKKIDPSFRGYPSYVVYKNNKLIKVHNGGRDEKDLEKLISSL